MGQKLSDMTTQKVIVGILAMLLIVPAFNIYSGLYGDYAGLTQGGLQIVHDLYLDVRPLCLLADKSCAALHMSSTASKHSFSECIAQELLDSFKKEGQSRQKGGRMHNLAAANRAYARYRWWLSCTTWYWLPS